MGKSNKRNTRATQSKQQTSINSSLEADIQQVYFHAVELHQQGKLQEASKLYQMILENKPNHADSLHYLGVISLQTKNFKSAYTLIKEAIRINPRVAAFHYNLATIYQEDQQFSSAIKHYKKAVKLQPKYAQALRNLAVIFHSMENIPLAKKANIDALKIEPDSTSALQNMATLLNETGAYDEATNYFNRVLSLDPMSIAAHYKKSHIQLLKGDFENGWRENYWMFMSSAFDTQKPIRAIPFPKWNGSPLKDKCLLINADQGVGDELMFMSCLPEVIGSAKSVIIECDHRLAGLLQRSYPELQKVIAAKEKPDFYWNQTLGHIDYKVSTTELANFYRKKESDFPKHQGYIHAVPNEVNHWKSRLQALKGSINIGISWYGGANDRTKKARSIPLKYWRELALLPEVNLINLQYGQHDEEIQAFNQKNNGLLHSFEEIDPLTDLDGFSSLLSALDLVISIDNTTVHFAGALGVPVWIILPYTPDWRWMLNRKDSLWYPSATLYRSESFGFSSLKKQLNIIVQDLEKGLEDNPHLTNKRAPLPSHNKAYQQAETLNLSPRPGYALLLNDNAGNSDWGDSCSDLALHNSLRAHWHAVVAIPAHLTNLLKPFPTSIEQIDSPEFFDLFSQANPRIIEKILAAETLYINDQNTSGCLDQSTLGLLYIAYIAKTKMNKKVILINHTCCQEYLNTDKDSLAYRIYQKTYQCFDYITVRDKQNLNALQATNANVEQSFDSLPLFIENMYDRTAIANQHLNHKNIIITGSATLSDTTMTALSNVIERFKQAGFGVKILVSVSNYTSNADVHFTQGLKDAIGTHCELLPAYSEEEWLNSIATAGLFISGKVNHGIAAKLLDTPLILLTEGTLETDPQLELLSGNNMINVTHDNFSNELYEKSLHLLETEQSTSLDENKKKVLSLAQSISKRKP